MNSKAKGEMTEGVILGHLMKMGRTLLIPFGNNQRYDLVEYREGKFIRGQCKTADFINGCVAFWACSKNGFTGVRKGYLGEIDVFWVYCPKLDKVYEIPVDHIGQTSVRLRVDPAKGGTKSNIRWAKIYQI